MTVIKQFIMVFFSSMSSWLNAFESVGKTVENLAGVGEAGSAAYRDVAVIERRINVKKKLAELGVDINSDEAKSILALPSVTAQA